MSAQLSLGFNLFGPLHWMILAGVLAVPAVLAYLSRRTLSPRLVRLCLAGVVAVSELTWYAYCLRRGGVSFPEGLPLQLCDLALWMTAAVLLSRAAWLYDVAYYWVLAGTGAALLTPDVGDGVRAYPFIQFFLAHGTVVAAVLYLAWAGILRPRPGSIRRAWLALNGYVIAMAGFNQLFGTNYVYLCRKPENPSLLNFMGPWPVYVIAADLLALVIFWALYLPYRKS